jgi:hypothetical protein
MSAGNDVVRMSSAQAQASLKNFVDGEKLRTIPARRLKKLVVFDWLAQRFDLGRVYTESEVNAALALAHDDVATLRRGMYDEYFLDRRDGTYWRTPDRQKLVIIDDTT